MGTAEIMSIWIGKEIMSPFKEHSMITCQSSINIMIHCISSRIDLVTYDLVGLD